MKYFKSISDVNGSIRMNDAAMADGKVIVVKTKYETSDSCMDSYTIEINNVGNIGILFRRKDAIALGKLVEANIDKFVKKKKLK